MLEEPEQHTKRMQEVISACGGDIGKADLQLVPQLYICVREDGIQCSLIVYLEDAGRRVMLWTGFAGKAGQI